jgi:hypothetical protein
MKLSRWLGILIALACIASFVASVVSVAQDVRRKWRSSGQVTEIIQEDPMRPLTGPNATHYAYEARTKCRNWWGNPDTIFASTTCPTIMFDPPIEGFYMDNLGEPDAYIWVNDAPDTCPWVLRSGHWRIMDDRVTIDSLRASTPAGTATILFDCWWYER